MDYVKGRACKMTVHIKDDKWLINDSWYDHTDDSLKKLLAEFNINVDKVPEHGIACNCYDCKNK